MHQYFLFLLVHYKRMQKYILLFLKEEKLAYLRPKRSDSSLISHNHACLYKRLDVMD